MTGSNWDNGDGHGEPIPDRPAVPVPTPQQAAEAALNKTMQAVRRRHARQTDTLEAGILRRRSKIYFEFKEAVRAANKAFRDAISGESK